MGHGRLQKCCGDTTCKKSHIIISIRCFIKKANGIAEKYFFDAAQRLILHTIAENSVNIKITGKDKVIVIVVVTAHGKC